MSEFQCYQFRSFDSPLTESQRKEVSSWSSRAQVSSHSATFIYNYRDFPYDEEKAVKKYFDAMLYFANWGTRRLMLRLPASLIDVEAIKLLCFEKEWSPDYIRLKKKGAVYLLDICFSDEGGGRWMEENEFDLGDIGQIRNDILQGDFRALYLAWAQFSQPYEVHEEEDYYEEEEKSSKVDGPFPPVPANLEKLSSALQAFIEFFEIDSDLLAAAQSVSPDNTAIAYDYEKMLRKLPQKEQFEWLARLLKGDETRLSLSLKKRLEKMMPTQEGVESKVLTPIQLQDLRIKEQENRIAQLKEAAKAAHIKKMEKIAKEKKRIWDSVSLNLERRSSKTHELATEALTDLRDLAIYQGEEEAFKEKMTALQQAFSSRVILMRQWKQKGLL